MKVISSLLGYKIFIHQLRIDKGYTSINTQMQRVTLDSLKTDKQARLFPTSDVNHEQESYFRLWVYAALKINTTVYLPEDGGSEFFRNFDLLQYTVSHSVRH